MKNIIFILSLLLFTCFISYSQETYKVGNTEYYYGRYYTSTCKPLVKRSHANIQKFLNSKGLFEIPKGYEVDHIIPLSEGGSDDPSNMQLLTVEQHQIKTAKERANTGNSTYTGNRTTYSTYSNKQYNYSTTNSNYSRTDSKGRIIYKGSRGGEYYISPNGSKVYISSGNGSMTNTTTTGNNGTSIGSSGKTIYTGSRGGKYYINSNGNKTYIKK
jgi:hypothetical protein